MISLRSLRVRSRLLACAGGVLLASAFLPAAAEEGAAAGTPGVAAGAAQPPAPGDVTLGSVVIEAEPIPEPTIDDLLRGFRDTLERDRQRRPLEMVERQLVSGALEVDTRYGRFCLAPLPSYLSSDLTSGIALYSRCSAF